MCKCVGVRFLGPIDPPIWTGKSSIRGSKRHPMGPQSPLIKGAGVPRFLGWVGKLTDHIGPRSLTHQKSYAHSLALIVPSMLACSAKRHCSFQEPSFAIAKPFALRANQSVPMCLGSGNSHRMPSVLVSGLIRDAFCSLVGARREPAHTSST